MRLLALALLLIPGIASARPYYAAKKGMSCAVCHVAPAGGGMRFTREGSPGRLTEAASIGGDLRAFLAKTENTETSSFSVPRSALYASVDARPDVKLVFGMDNSITSQVYGIWRSDSALLPLYVKAGRFWLPYGMQWDDPDHSGFSRVIPFAPNVGFDMANGAADTGVEFGLAPKKEYFVNLAVTNGQPAGSADNNDRKAVSGRAGWFNERFMLGGTFYSDKTGPTTLHQKQNRFGPLAWVNVGPAVLLYEGGFGSNELNSGGKTNLTAHAAELDVEPAHGWLGKARFDALDPDTSVANDDVQRYSIGLERMLMGLSFELTYRMNREKPKVKNDQYILQGHLWF